MNLVAVKIKRGVVVFDFPKLGFSSAKTTHKSGAMVVLTKDQIDLLNENDYSILGKIVSERKPKKKKG